MSSNKKLSIVFATTDNYKVSGCGWYRSFLPAYWLARLFKEMEVMYTDGLYEFDIGLRDIFFFTRQCKDDVVEFMQKIKAGGKKVVIDLDDNLFAIPPYNPAYRYYQKPRLEVLKEAIKLCDFMTFTHSYLAEITFNQVGIRKPYLLLPNAVDTRFAQEHPREADTIKIGWFGSPTHIRDIYLIRGLLDDVIKLTKKHLIFISFGPRREFIEKTFDIRKINWKHYDWLPPEDYLMKIRELGVHIGLAPLPYSQFNACKSNLKLLEYVYAGAVPLASNNPPFVGTYSVGGKWLVKDKYADWKKSLLFLIENDEYRQNLHSNLLTELKGKYDVQVVYRQFGIDLLKRVGG